jgi:hypothetical protein
MSSAKALRGIHHQTARPKLQKVIALYSFQPTVHHRAVARDFRFEIA